MLARRLARFLGTAALLSLPLVASCGSEPTTPAGAGQEASRNSSSTFSITLYGANNKSVPRNSYCTWEVGLSGGTAPYTFQWRGPQGVGAQQSFTQQIPDEPHGELVWIEVFVTDGSGQSDYADALVWVGGPSATC